MADAGLTPQDYELHLRDLKERLVAYLERGEGDLKKLHRDAEELLSMVDEFAEVYARFPELEGMLAEMLAKEKQLQFMPEAPAADAPGCLLGLLLQQRKKKKERRE